MIGEAYWSTGVTLKWFKDDRWTAEVKFFDSGFCEDKSTEGHLITRYYINIQTAIDTIIADAEKIGIEFKKNEDGQAMLFGKHDGLSEDWPMPSNWRQILIEQAERIGWKASCSKHGEKILRPI